MATIIVSTTPEPVRWHNKLTVASSTGTIHHVAFYTDDEGVDADTINATDGSDLPTDVLDFLCGLAVDNDGSLSGESY